MKKIIVLFSALSLLFSANAQKSLTITGKVDGLTEGKVYLSKMASQSPIKVDSTVAVNGSFAFKKGIAATDIYMLNFGKARAGVLLFPEKENIVVTVKLINNAIETSDVKAGPLQMVFQDYTKALKENRMEMNKLYPAYQKAKKDNNQAEIDRLEKELTVKSDAFEATENKIQENNATNLLGIYFVVNKVYYYDYEKLKGILEKTDANTKKSEVYKNLQVRLDKMDKVRVGSMAPDFTLPTPEGKMISLSQFRGKVLVVDCWASWCGPCRAENPNMVALYNANKDKNFTILGVSLDRDKDKWVKAIADDKLAWNHVSDLKFWQSMICDLYVISAVPETILIDKDGKIAARGLRGEELKAKVAELLK